MSTCRTCRYWTDQNQVLEREDQPGHFYTLGSCGHDLVYVDALDLAEGGPGEYMVLTTEDATCEHHEARS